ncbi:phospho-sugar glycosidase domain-containing protein [Anaerosolibacter sp.]|uniref:phospho-sugar glycosidase domain-containing protein n=1 Tax=Anaerosolibacter sp. TaxID=1872527 RepID=UPI0039EEEE6A
MKGLPTDPGEYVIRSQEAREWKDGKIFAVNTLERYRNCVTIDNEGYKRYEGELQILKKQMEKDDRVNLVAEARNAEVLIDMLKPGEKFAFEIMEDEI